MRRRICAFVFRIWHKQVFSWSGSYNDTWCKLKLLFIINVTDSSDTAAMNSLVEVLFCCHYIWAPSSEFVSSSIPSWQILTAHAQPFRGARDLAFCLKVPLDSLLVWASSEGSGETARMRRLAWTFAARIGYKYQIRLTRSILPIVPWQNYMYDIVQTLKWLLGWSISIGIPLHPPSASIGIPLYLHIDGDKSLMSL